MGAVKQRMIELYDELAAIHDAMMALHNAGRMPASVRADLYDAAWTIAHAAATVCMEPDHLDPLHERTCVESPDKCIRTRWVPGSDAHVRVLEEVSK